MRDGYTTYGPVRGFGPMRRTKVAAEKDLARDVEICHALRGRSDRKMYRVIDGVLYHRQQDSEDLVPLNENGYRVVHPYPTAAQL